MARKEADLKTVQVTQFLKSEYWNWTDDEKKAIGNVQSMLEVILNRLQAGGCIVSELHGIHHDKDKSISWDSNTLTEVIVQKENHVHIVIKFEKGATLSNLSALIGVEPQYLEKAKSGKFGYDNMLAYLTHVKYTDKHQYDPTEVCTLMGRPYTEVYANRYTDWIKGRAKVNATKANTDIDYLEELILTGQVYKEQVILTDEYYQIYARNARRCDDAFRVYGERRAYKTMQALRDGDFILSVIFITGKAGNGKSHFANNLCDDLIQKSKSFDVPWRVCKTAATNPLDEFNGEEILYMDDVRGGALTASDWLKLLDPKNISPGSARYKNKTPACRCVIITSTKTMIEFFSYCKQIGGGDKSEALDQFIRRIMANVTVFNTDGDRTVNIAVPVKTTPYNLQLSDSNNVALSYDVADLADGKDLSFDNAVNLLTDMIINCNNLKFKTEMSDIDKKLIDHQVTYNAEKILRSFNIFVAH